MSTLSDNLRRFKEDASKVGPAHIIGMARAGTGKTTTGEEGLKVLRGLPTRITPSVQQAAIWEAMKESAGVRSVGFTAFGADIAAEVKARLTESGLDKKGVEGLTTHSMGAKAVRRAFKLREGRDAYNQFIVRDYIEEVTGVELKKLRKDEPTVLTAVEQLVGLVKQTLSGVDESELLQLADHYSVELGNKYQQDKIINTVPGVIEKCLDPSSTGQIDFNDMCWLPVVCDLPMWRYNLLIVDEAQDLNRARQELVKKASYRLMLVGDDRQAIFGFAGADAESMPRMQRDLTDTREGVKLLPLTVTRRCGKAIVNEAKQFVPDFEAHDSNPEGLVTYDQYPWYRDSGGKLVAVKDNECYLEKVLDGDRVICRSNAPLVTNCFRFVRMGRKATILGRNIGEGLKALIEQLRPDSLVNLICKLQAWMEQQIDKERALKNPSESKIQAIADRVMCISFFVDGAQTVDDVLRKIDSVFSDNENKGGVLLSSIHKAKGLEADNVWFLKPWWAQPPRDKMQAWEVQQEDNLDYVGITRARRKLVYVM